jgi:lysozyme family protein
MAQWTYDESLRRLLVHEGGYTNDAADPGGPTNFGITIYDYRKYVKPNATAADVRAMKIEEAKSIYRAKYWDAQRCDELPAGVDYAVFDYGVNSGIGRAKKVLQRMVGVPADGVLGDATIKALAQRPPSKIIIDICEERLRFLQGLRTWPVFGKGWGRRVAEVKTVALAMAANAPPPRNRRIRRVIRSGSWRASPASHSAPRPASGCSGARGRSNNRRSLHDVGQDQSVVQALGDHSVGARGGARRRHAGGGAVAARRPAHQFGGTDDPATQIHSVLRDRHRRRDRAGAPAHGGQSLSPCSPPFSPGSVI